jgi:glycosyltransferase involved in cell wall biosynthesis
MRICHVVIITPHRCGLYETARELVAAERALGHDARMYDPRKPGEQVFRPAGDEDRGAVFADAEFLRGADVIADHSGCDGTTDDINTPHILVAHGRPRHSFNSERDGGAPIYSYHYRLDRTEKYRAVVTFWEEHVPHHRVMFKRKPVYAVPAPVDLKAWSPDGPKGYDFHGKHGTYNIVITDAWRDDVDPFEALNASILAARELPGTRIHIFGKPSDAQKGWGALLNTAKDDGSLGEVAGWIKGLDNVYRAADLLVTPNAIATRAVREAMACGCPVVSVAGGRGDARAVFYALISKPTDARAQAERRFNPLNTAHAFIAIAERAAA